MKDNKKRIGNSTDIFKALNDPTRFVVVELLLQDNGMSVQDMRHIIRIEPTLFSCHLRVLRKFGLVKTEKIGKYVIYSLNDSVNTSTKKYKSVTLNGIKVLFN